MAASVYDRLVRIGFVFPDADEDQIFRLLKETFQNSDIDIDCNVGMFEITIETYEYYADEGVKSLESQLRQLGPMYLFHAIVSLNDEAETGLVCYDSFKGDFCGRFF
jgi:hypothetical protein